MRRLLAGLLLLGLPLGAGAASGAATPPPARIASLNLTADEVLVEILPPGRLVAVTSYADEQGTSNVAGRVPAGVARFAKVDLERLLALAPDLVVVSEYTDADFLRLLDRSGLRAHRMVGLDTLPGIRKAILDLGLVVGQAPGAERLVARFDRIHGELAGRLQGRPRPRVLYWAGQLTAGAHSAIGSLIEASGGVNVGREMGLVGLVPANAERAFVADPDVVLVGTWEGSTRALTEHPLLSRLRAVRERRIVQMPNELLVTLSHHAAEACWYLGHILHPDQVSGPAP